MYVFDSCLVAHAWNEPRSKGIISGKSRTLDIGERPCILRSSCCYQLSCFSENEECDFVFVARGQSKDAFKQMLQSIQARPSCARYSARSDHVRQLWWSSSRCSWTCHRCKYRSLARILLILYFCSFIVIQRTCQVEPQKCLPHSSARSLLTTNQIFPSQENVMPCRPCTFQVSSN